MVAGDIKLKNVLVVDDHAVMRDGINLMLSALAPGVAVHEASTAIEAIDLARQLPDLDLILLDLSLTDGSQSFQTIEKLCGLPKEVPVVILSADEKTLTVRESIRHGAKGYLPKSSPQSVMHNAIRLVLGGGIYIPHTTLDTTGELDFENIECTDTGQMPGGINEHLTSRQVEILKLIAKGKTNNEIADILGMSAATVRTHLTMIFKRLGVKNRTEASHAAYKSGLDPDS